MGKTKKCILYCFRYQLLPTSKDIQVAYAPHSINSYDELVAVKNDLFKEVIQSKNFLQSEKEEISSRLEEEAGNLFKFRIGLKRGVEVIKKDFSKSRVENWPNSVVLINNDPAVQKIFIQHNVKVAADARTLLNIVVKSLNKFLRKYQLCVLVEPIFEAKVFWDLVQDNWNRITVIDFELITPNLANISGRLSKELKSLQKDTNTQKTNLKLQSDPQSCLDIKADNNQIKDIVDYAAEGGGNIRLRIRGFKKYVNTAKNVKQIEVDEISLENYSLKDFLKILPELFK